MDATEVDLSGSDLDNVSSVDRPLVYVLVYYYGTSIVLVYYYGTSICTSILLWY